MDKCTACGLTIYDTSRQGMSVPVCRTCIKQFNRYNEDREFWGLDTIRNIKLWIRAGCSSKVDAARTDKYQARRKYLSLSSAPKGHIFLMALVYSYDRISGNEYRTEPAGDLCEGEIEWTSTFDTAIRKLEESEHFSNT